MDMHIQNLSIHWTMATSTGILSYVTETGGVNSFKDAFEIAIYAMTVPIPPILWVIGLFGNVLSYILMNQKKYEKSTACLYMRSLAVLDCFYIYGRMFLRYLLVMAPHLFQNKEVKHYFCLYYFVSFRMGVFLSPWMLVVMAFDRFFAVNWPLKAAMILTMRRAKIAVIAVCGSGALFGMVQLTRTWQEKYSHWLCPYEYDPPMDLMYSYIGGIVETFIPIISISFFNVGILLAVHRSRRNKILQKTATQTNDTSSINLATFLMTSTFIVFRIPAKVNDFFWEYWQGEMTEEVQQWKIILLNIGVLAEGMIYCFNSYIYVLACKRLRKEMFGIICSRKLQ
jgi:hypothetical protein